jgi:WXG100 family type VII secretion target
MGDRVQVTYAELEHAQKRMQEISLSIDSKLDTLRARLEAMDWSGKDREAYNIHKAEWDRAIKDLNALLNEIGAAVGIAKDNYLTTELDNVSTWS